MDFKFVFELCKNYFGDKIRYVKKLKDNIYEVHECRKKSTVKYIIEILDGKIKILEEKED